MLVDYLVLIAFLVHTFHIVIPWGEHLIILQVTFLKFAFGPSFATNFLDPFFIKRLI